MANRTIHPGVQIGHVHLKVRDAALLTKYYTEMIGFKVLGKEGSRTLLTADGKRALLVLDEDPALQLKPQRTTGLYHFAILLPTRADLARALLYMAEAKVPIGGASDHAVSEALYLDDPEGNGIEIYADRPREHWEGRIKENMVTQALDVNGLVAEAGDGVWQGLPPQTTIGHMHLHVGSLHVSEQFYVAKLGLDLQARMGGSAYFLSAGGYHHHLGINSWAGSAKPPVDSTGLAAYALQFPDQKALDQTVAQLEAGGCHVQQEPGYAVVEDPDSNRIELRVKPLGL